MLKHYNILKIELKKKRSKNKINFWIFFSIWLAADIGLAIRIDDLVSARHLNDLKNIQGTIGILLFINIFCFIMWIIYVVKWGKAEGGLNILNKINIYEEEGKKKNK